MLLSAGRGVALGMTGVALPITTEAIFMMAGEIDWAPLPFCRLCRALDEVYLDHVGNRTKPSQEQPKPKP